MQLFDLIIHMDRHLGELISQMGPWFYGLVWLIIFSETGLVIAPFLPGDSLLFAIGAFAAKPEYNLNIYYLVPMLVFAAIIGDAVNYSIGKWVGPQIFRRDTGWIMNKQHLLRAQAFYEKHGGKAIVLARFLPILRTFAPFVAGIGGMEYRRFWLYNVSGAVAWVCLFLIGGYAFGNLEIVKRYFHLVIVGIILVSVLPILWEFYAERKFRNRSTGGSNE